jgi:hypothetical protein
MGKGLARKWPEESIQPQKLVKNKYILKYLDMTEYISGVTIYSSVSQRPGPGINYTGPQEVLLEVVILVSKAFFMNKYFIVEIF